VNALECRLRAAYGAAAETVSAQDVRDLPVLPPLPARPSGRRARGLAPRRGLARRRVLIPLAAAAAVTAVVVVVQTLAPQAAPRSAGQQIPSAVRSALTGAGAATREPPFFVGVMNDNRYPDARVYNARTGQLIGRIAAPGKDAVVQDVAATGNSRTFLIAATRGESPSGSACQTFLYRVRLTTRGQVASLAPLSVPVIQGLISSPTALYASASGTVIGYFATGCRGGGGGDGWMGVLDLRTGYARTWTVHGGTALGVSLSPSGRMLAYTYDSDTNPDAPATIRTMPVSAPAGPALKRSRVLLSGRADYGAGVLYNAAFSATGTVMLACTVRFSPHVATLNAYDVASGRRLAVLHSWRHEYTEPCALAVPPAGRYALVYQIRDTSIAIRVDLATGVAEAVPGNQASRSNPPGGIAW
jgi:hypothetical protein